MVTRIYNIRSEIWVVPLRNLAAKNHNVSDGFAVSRPAGEAYSTPQGPLTGIGEGAGNERKR